MTTVTVTVPTLKKEPVFVCEAFEIPELAYWLNTYCMDNDTPAADLDLPMIVEEAEYVLGLFFTRGTHSYNMLHGAEGKGEQAYARDNVKAIRSFIRQYKGA